MPKPPVRHRTAPALRTGLTVCAAVAALLAAPSTALAQGQQSQSSDEDTPASASVPRKRGESGPVVIEAKRWLFNRETRYAHSLPEVDGTTITVTKKTSVVKLDEQPTVIDNNQRAVFDRFPGIVLAEQQNPTQLNLSYRGLGNPQESEFVLVMQDGIPLELDWIGYPTLYYLPVPQTLGSVQMIRGGSGLLYGPEPQPVINFVSRASEAGRPFSGTTEQVGGNQGLFSSFNAISGSTGPWDYSADYSRRQSDGQRLNGDYTLNSGDVQVGFRPDSQQRLSLAVHAYSLQSGLAGLMSGAQFHTDRNQTTTPDDRLWTDRYSTVLTYDNAFTDRDRFTQKAWTGYTDLITRSDQYNGLDDSAIGGMLAGQRFHFTGLDGRLLHRWGTGNALTLGYTAYWSKSPYTEFLSRNPLADRDDESGVPFYRDERQTRYAALFGENVFRFKYFHLVTSARLDHEELSTHETTAPHMLLVDATYRKTVPLFGVGIGNDFGQGNETYLNVSQGFRPLRYLDIASPFSNFSPTNNPDPTKYLTYEAGVHGWPSVGLYYDVSLFQVNVKNRIESQQLSQTETVDVNTGDTRSRGAELEGAYDLLRLWPEAAANQHVTVFANASFLNARFTSSIIRGQSGKTPAYAPDYVLKAGITLRQDARYKLSLIAATVASQFFQDSDLSVGTTPAGIPPYTLIDLDGEYVIAGHLRLLGGIANLADRHYYSRVFLFGGQLEPGRDRTFHAGLAYNF